MKESRLFIDRELSWIKFNERVLEEARSLDNPLIERLRFAAIFQSNYEEFFRVRVGSLCDKLLVGAEDGKDDRREVKKQLEDIYAETKKLLPVLDDSFRGILDAGKKYFTRVSEENISPAERVVLKQLFEREIAPFITPFIIEKKHPFPFFDNAMMVVGVTIAKKSGGSRFGLIPIRSSLPRAVFLPGKNCRFMLIEDLISMFAHKVFHKFVITEKIIFSVIRNADIDENEGLYDFDIDFRETMSRLIELRSSLAPVELKYIGKDCDKILAHLRNVLFLSKRQLFRQETPLNMGFISLLEKRLDREKYPGLYYSPLSPQYPATVDRGKSIIDRIIKRDVLLSYPFEDIQMLIDLMDEAAADERVKEIKISLYRVASNSKIVQALIDAARRGKKVTCLVELRARFDEENNIDWSKRLEDAGCRVIYGISNYKVHCKLLIIGLRDGRDIIQIGTGNFNESTARLYTDLALFTANPAIASDSREVFRCLENGSFVEEAKELLVAPLGLKSGVIALIDNEIEKKRAGRPAEITLKMNSLTDKELINKLIEASMNGVKIKMIIRGICCLVPGVAGKTENIEVYSIVGRLLEHSRIYAFGAGREKKYYISSADFMTRNTTQRVEVAVPVHDYMAKLKLARILRFSLQDNQKLRRMRSDGTYVNVHRSVRAKEHNMQQELFDEAYAASDAVKKKKASTASTGRKK